MHPGAASVVEFLRNLKPGQVVLVSGHVRPDGDAVGSTLALVHSLLLAGVEATPLLVDNKPAPEFYQWLEGFERYVTPAEVERWPHIDAYIVLDTPLDKRLSAAAAILDRAETTVLIDHHPALDEFTDLRYIDTGAAAAAHIVWDLISTAALPVDRTVATACFTGLASDTGRFMFSNTTAAAFQAAAEMVEAGVSVNEVNVRLFSSKTAEVLELEGLVLERMMILNDGKVTASWLTQADFDSIGVRRDEAESIIDVIRTLEGSEISLLVIFGDTSTRVSLRSKSAFNVGAIAEAFGGGGHQAAAGVNWPDMAADLSTILDAILPLLPHA